MTNAGAVPDLPSTAVIDEALATVRTIRSQLGVGFPIMGTEYEIAAQQLRMIAADMAQAFGSAPWGGPAGEMFAVESQALTNSVAELAAMDRMVHFVIRKQAGGIMQARSELDQITTDLEMVKTTALALAESGNLPASLTLQQVAANEAASKCSVAVENLRAVTANQTLKMARLRSDLIIFERRLRGGFVPILPQASPMVSVAPAELGYMASAVGGCSTNLAAARSRGPRILDEVRLTHGNRFTEAFNSLLADFEIIHGNALGTMWSGVELRATSLTRAARKYEQCDTAAADALQGSSKRRKLAAECGPPKR